MKLSSTKLRLAVLLSLSLSVPFANEHVYAAGPYFSTTAGTTTYNSPMSASSAGTPSTYAYIATAGTAYAAAGGNGSGVNVVFNDGLDVQLDSSVDGNTYDVHGIGAYNDASVQINGSSLNVVNDAAHSIANDNEGLAARQNSSITDNAAASAITVGGGGANNIGIKVYENGNITIQNPLTMNVTSSKGSAVGISIDPGDGTTATGVSTGSVTTGDVTMTVASSASGIAVSGVNIGTGGYLGSSGSYTANGNLIINTNLSNSGYTTGLNNGGTNGSSIILKKNGTINSSSAGGNFYGISNAAGDTVSVAGDMAITYTAAANSTMGETMGITNSGILSLNNVDVTINGNNSYFQSIDGIKLSSGSSNTITGNVNIDINNVTGGGSIFAVNTGNNTLTIGGDVDIQLNDLTTQANTTYIDAFSGGIINLNGKTNTIVINGHAGWLQAFNYNSLVNIADNSTTNIAIKYTGNDNYLWQMQGIFGNLKLGKNAVLNINMDAGNGKNPKMWSEWLGGVFGLNLVTWDGSSVLDSGSKTHITVSGEGVENVDRKGYNGTVGIDGGNLIAKGDVQVDVLSADGIGVRVSGGDSLYTGNLVVNTNKGYAVATVGSDTTSSISIHPDTGEKVQLTGDLQHFKDYSTDTGGPTIDINFITPDSFLTGASLNAAGNVDTYQTNLNFSNSSRWNMTGDSVVTNLTNNDATIDMTADDKQYSTLTAENLSGTNGKFILDIDGTQVNKNDKIYVTDTFTGNQILALKEVNGRDGDSTLGKEAAGTVLASVNNNNGTFTAADGEGTLYWKRYTLSSEASSTSGYTTDWYLKAVEYVPPTEKPTTTVDTAFSARESAYYLWRDDDQLMKRLGDLRQDGENTEGFWIRNTGSEFEKDNTFGFKTKYNRLQAGYDKLLNNNDDKKVYGGVAVSYTDGSSTYDRGSGDIKETALSLYRTQINNDGHYLDMILTAGHLRNDFTAYNTDGYEITGHPRNDGITFSTEYGYKKPINNGWYIEPQAQLTLGYLGGDTYNTSNNVRVHENGVRSAIGRAGFNIGHSDPDKKANIYAKLNVLHEFGGVNSVQMSDTQGDHVVLDEDCGGTWLQYGIGADFKLGSNARLYLDAEKSAGGGSFTHDWQWNAGARWMF